MITPGLRQMWHALLSKGASRVPVAGAPESVRGAEEGDISPKGEMSGVALGCAGVDEVAEGLEGGAGRDVGELRD
jgi:hypothetical protein